MYGQAKLSKIFGG